MDVGSITAGQVWPERIRRALGDASLMLSVIGPRWLTAADEFGRRRLDDPEDWVRVEILEALTTGKRILPVLVGGENQLPSPAGLPPEMRGFLQNQAIQLRDDYWDSDLAGLVRVLAEHQFVDNQKPVPLPQPLVKRQPMSPAELDAALETLPGWQPVESLIPGDYPRSRVELRKAYGFKSFREAIGFMEAAVERINQLKHHPRWENQWRTVTVYLTTWDIGNRITDLDIQLARSLDELYASVNN
jgi:pterin-4a-carbinolamine dehydratase